MSGKSEAQVIAEAARSLPYLVRWALERYHDDLPARLHGRGPWNGPQQYGGADAVVRVDAEHTTSGHIEYQSKQGASGRPRWPGELVGGSRSGSPRLADAFRRYLEDSPYAVEFAEFDNVNQRDPHYARPFAANLAKLAQGRPLLARRLFFCVACCGGELLPFGKAAAEEQRVLYEAAFRALYDGWRTEPPARVLRSKEAA